MKKIAAAAKLVLADLSQLNKPAVATAITAVVAPVIALIVTNVTGAEVMGWLLVTGGIAAAFQKLEAVSTPAKPPVAPPTLVAVPPAPVEPAKPAPPAA